MACHGLENGIMQLLPASRPPGGPDFTVGQQYRHLGGWCCASSVPAPRDWHLALQAQLA